MAPLPGRSLSRRELRKIALLALAPVGDRSFEWEEERPAAFHLRRRLTEDEQAAVGEAVDCRGTADALQRLELMRPFLGRAGMRFALEELASKRKESR